MMDRVHSKVGKLLAQSNVFVLLCSVANTRHSLVAMRPQKCAYRTLPRQFIGKHSNDVDAQMALGMLALFGSTHV